MICANCKAGFESYTVASSGESLQVRLDKFLLAYRNALHAFTGEMPAERFMGRQLRTRLDSVKPDNRQENKRLEKQMERGSQNLRSFREGDMVWVRDYHGNDKWVWKRHIDQLSSRVNSSNMPLTQ